MSKTRRGTQKKYTAFIQECYEKKTFNFPEMRGKYKIDASILSTLREIGALIIVGNGFYNWIYPNVPDQAWIDTVIDLHRIKTQEYKESRAERASTKQDDQPNTEDSGEVTTPTMTEEQAINFLKGLGCYEIFKVQRKQV